MSPEALTTAGHAAVTLHFVPCLGKVVLVLCMICCLCQYNMLHLIRREGKHTLFENISEEQERGVETGSRKTEGGGGVRQQVLDSNAPPDFYTDRRR